MTAHVYCDRCGQVTQEHYCGECLEDNGATSMARNDLRAACLRAYRIDNQRGEDGPCECHWCRELRDLLESKP